MMTQKITKGLLLTLFLNTLLTAPIAAAEEKEELTQQKRMLHGLSQKWNNLSANNIDKGVFEVEQGVIVYKGEGRPPTFATDFVIDNIGFEGGYPIFLNPFKFYKYEEWTATYLHWYCINVLSQEDVWKHKEVRDEELHYGYNLLAETYTLEGKYIFKEIHEYRQKKAQRHQFWKTVTKEALPSIITITKNPAIIAASFGGVFILICVPLIVWNISKAIAAMMSVRRPTILTDEDTDIYTSW